MTGPISEYSTLVIVKTLKLWFFSNKDITLKLALNNDLKFRPKSIKNPEKNHRNYYDHDLLLRNNDEGNKVSFQNFVNMIIYKGFHIEYFEYCKWHWRDSIYIGILTLPLSKMANSITENLRK